VDEKSLIDDLWPALEPSRDFSARVAAALDGIEGKPVPRRRLAGALASVGVAAVLALVITYRLTRPRAVGRHRSTWGDVQAVDRETVDIGERAVAVAEAGAELGWSSASGRVRVDQRRGSVFYRVEHGTPFVVATGAAEVQVTGTCFQVEVDGAVSVRVFEGSVAVSNSAGRAELSAGERVRVEAGHAPTRLAVGDAPDALARRERDRDRVKQLERALQEARREADESVPGLLPERKFLDFSPEERKVLAARCEFRYARPEHLIGFGPPDLGGRFGLDERERAAVVQIMEDQRTRFVEDLRAIYIEIVGDRTTASKLSPIALVDEINSKARPGEDDEARNRLYDEWAGRSVPPDVSALAARPPVERFWRLLASATDTFTRRLSEVVGLERARAIARSTVHDSVMIRGPCGRFKTR
jgi:hypothetical protein